MFVLDEHKKADRLRILRILSALSLLDIPLFSITVSTDISASGDLACRDIDVQEFPYLT